MIQYLFSYSKRRQYALVACDVLILALAIFISYAIRVYINHWNPSMGVVVSKLKPSLTLVILVHLFTLFLFDQYNLDRLINIMRSSIMIFSSILLAGIVIGGIFFFFPKYVFGRKVLIIHLVVVSFFMILWRIFFIKFLADTSKTNRIAIVGNGQIVSSFIEELHHILRHGFDVSGVCLTDEVSGSTCPVPAELPKYKSILELLERNDFDVFAFDARSGSFSDSEIRQILELKYRGKAVYDLPRLYKNLTGKVPLTYIDGRWLLNSDGLQGQVSVRYMRIKRVLDVILSLLLLITGLPLFFIIGVAIKLDSKGKVFFMQERLGINKRPFKCIKFRTMVENAEYETGPIWSREDDRRITRMGRLLRKTRLDELPQLWNILKGDMSFVGPRPIREHFAARLSKSIPYYSLRFSVKPGLTGWAQVNYDYAGSEAGQLEKFQYEIFYIENMSLLLDLLTIFRTLQKVVTVEGT
jgi:exopolysaccharide biosynthesis polyprenyl glycosylphosphotransferase